MPTLPSQVPTPDTTPASSDLIYKVNDPYGTPANDATTLGNAVTKAHGLSDGLLKVASGIMTGATANTDYYAPKAKLNATVAPGTSNDNTEGYSIGSVWVDVTNDKSYIAVDVSTGAAVWNDLTASVGGGLSNVVEDTTPQLGGDLDLNGKNITTGATTISPTEMSYLDGVSSAIQTQLDGKQALDSDLTTIAGLTATTDNFIQAKSNAWASRTPAQVAADLPAVVGDSGSGGTKGLVPAPASGDTAAGKFLKADGTWAAPSGSTTPNYTPVITVEGSNLLTSAGFTKMTEAAATNTQSNGAWRFQNNTSTDSLAGFRYINFMSSYATLNIFDKKVRQNFIFNYAINASSATEVWMGQHADEITSNAAWPMTMTTKHIGIHCVVASGTGTWYASNANGTSRTTTNITSYMNQNGSNSVVERIVIESNTTSIKFYVNGTLRATHTTNIPTGTNTNGNILAVFNGNTTGTVNNRFDMYLAQLSMALDE